jgi:hypothetical protein
MTSKAIEPRDDGDMEVSVSPLRVGPDYPEPQARVTKWFGTRRVDWCWGEQPDSWKDAHRHWLEVHISPNEIVRQSVHCYDQPAYLEYKGEYYTAFTAYWDGCMPIEQPMKMTQGTDQ